MTAYLLWTTRNGQKQWSGPYRDAEAARQAAWANHHAKEMGFTVTKGSATHSRPVIRLMTRDEATAFQAAYGAEVRRLGRLTRAQLQRESEAELDTRGVERIHGGPVTRDELIQELLRWSYPVERYNEATHVLHHAPDETRTACTWCHPHQGEACECGLGRADAP